MLPSSAWLRRPGYWIKIEVNVEISSYCDSAEVKLRSVVGDWPSAKDMKPTKSETDGSIFKGFWKGQSQKDGLEVPICRPNTLPNIKTEDKSLC